MISKSYLKPSRVDIVFSLNNRNNLPDPLQMIICEMERLAI